MASPATEIQMEPTTTNDECLGKDEYFKDCYRLHHVIYCPRYKTNLIATFYKLMTKYFLFTALYTMFYLFMCRKFV